MGQISAGLMAVPTSCLLAWGWRRRAIAFLAGAVGALGLPPVGFWPLLGVAVPALVWLLDGAVEQQGERASSRWRRGFSIGWWFGFGYFLTGLWWIGAAFLVDGDTFAWMMPAAVVAMPAGLAFFPGFALSVAARFWPDRPHRILVLILALSLSDYVRGHVLSGFPWNLFAHTFSTSLILAQTASLVGIYGLGLLALVVAAVPAILIDPVSRRTKVLVVGFGGLILVAMTVFGILRLNWSGDPGPAALDIRIVQPSIPQDQKWLPEKRDEIFQTYLDLSSRPLGSQARPGAPRLLVWPESALPFLLNGSPGSLLRIADVLDGRMSLATGAIRAEAGINGPDYFNSVYLLGPDGVIEDAYDKVHLVPFGEYLPFADLLEAIGVRQLVTAPGAFVPGFRHKTMTSAAGFTFLPLICYEAIFPGIPAADDARPDFLLNVTNDAWFGRTPGPYQHLAQSKLRAIEQGIPLVRAANTGISVVVDAKGRESGWLVLGQAGILDTSLPGKMRPTLYARYGDETYLIMLIFIVILIGICQYNPHSRKN